MSTPCEDCDGTGAVICPACFGTCERWEFDDENGASLEQCATCNYGGEVDCEACGGTGEVEKDDAYETRLGLVENPNWLMSGWSGCQCPGCAARGL